MRRSQDRGIRTFTVGCSLECEQYAFGIRFQTLAQLTMSRFKRQSTYFQWPGSPSSGRSQCMGVVVGRRISSCIFRIFVVTVQQTTHHKGGQSKRVWGFNTRMGISSRRTGVDLVTSVQLVTHGKRFSLWCKAHWQVQAFDHR